jgi:hypothetical protein
MSFTTFKPAACNALRAFRSSKPWRGTLEERRRKFEHLHPAMLAAYELPGAMLVMPTYESSGRSNGGPLGNHRIVLTGKLSVVTYLYCLGRLRGFSPTKAKAWAFAIFKRIFPYSYARCRIHDGLLIQVEPRPAVEISPEAAEAAPSN